MVNDNINNLSASPDSSWLNPKSNSLDKIKEWILISLGAPLVTVELTDVQLNKCISDALEKYTKYAFFPDKYLAYNLKYYEKGVGANLAEFKVESIKEISFSRDRLLGLTNNDMFFGPQAWFMGNGGYPFFGSRGNFSGSFTTYHNLHEFFDLTKRMTGSNPDFVYDKVTKYLRIMPEPKRAGENMDIFILLTCQCEPDMEELYGNEYVKRLALAYSKILLGTIRKKFQNVTLLGGGTVDISIGDEGREELSQIMDNIQKDESRGQSWQIC